MQGETITPLHLQENNGNVKMSSKKIFKYLVLFYTCLTVGYSVACAENKTIIEIDPFVSKDYIKAPEAMCKYEGIAAGCDQLIITLYRKNDNIIHPAKEDILHLPEIINIIKQESGRLIGQIRDLAILQIEVKPADKLLKLKRKLESSGYVKNITFNKPAEFI
jgi:hypothetical protein